MNVQKKWKGWTRQDNNKVRELYLAKKSDEEIAQELGRSTLSIQQKRSKLGVTKFRRKAKKAVKQRGGAVSPLKPTDLAVAQSVLKQLGYQITITKTSN